MAAVVGALIAFPCATAIPHLVAAWRSYNAQYESVNVNRPAKNPSFSAELSQIRA